MWRYDPVMSWMSGYIGQKVGSPAWRGPRAGVRPAPAANAPASAGRDAADGQADQVGDARGERAQRQLPQRAAPEGPVGEPGDEAAADDRGERGQAEGDPEGV